MPISRIDIPGYHERLALAPGGPVLAVDRIPDACPVCHRAGTFLVLTHNQRRETPVSRDDRTEVVFVCPSKACQRLFVVSYEKYALSGAGVHVTREVHPFEPDQDQLPEEPRKISESFETIYRQAQKAEALRLDHIAGMGFRKSLEFLIKDFLCSRHPDKAKDIEASPLSTCISKYIDSPQVKSTAERAAWLGNDETHYVRKWPEQDVEDLKTLIRLCAAWIEQVVLTERLQERMPERR